MAAYFLHPLGFASFAVGVLAWAFAFWMVTINVSSDLKSRPRGLYFLYLASLISILMLLLLYPIVLLSEFTTDYHYLFFEYIVVCGVVIFAIVLAGWHRKIWGGWLATGILFCLSFRYEIMERIAAPAFDPSYGQGGCGNRMIPTDYFPVDLFAGCLLWGLTYLIAMQQKPRTT